MQTALLSKEGLSHKSFFALTVYMSSNLTHKLCDVMLRQKDGRTDGHIFQHLQAKLCNFTNFKMLFRAVVKDFVLLA